MRAEFAFILLFVAGLLGGSASAQWALDPDSATLSRGGVSPEPDDLDTARFKKLQDTPRPQELKRKAKQTPTNDDSADAQTNGQVGNPPAPTPVKSATAPTTATNPAAPAIAPNATANPGNRPTLTQQLKTLVLGDSAEIEDLRKQVHPEDRRNNVIELSIAPTYFYDRSAGNYSFRRYTAEGPGASADMTAWLSPFFGLRAGYFTSLNSTVMSEGINAVPLTVQDIEVGARFRRYFGMSRKSTSLSLGIDYFNDSESVPSNTPDRVTTNTSGLSFSLQANVASSLTYTHIFGVELRPLLVHSESSAANIQSGGGNDTQEIGAWVGGEVVFDRHNQMFWRLKQTVEQNTFNGPANTPDPATGNTPNGVSVTHGLTLFSIGYEWGG